MPKGTHYHNRKPNRRELEARVEIFRYKLNHAETMLVLHEKFELSDRDKHIQAQRTPDRKWKLFLSPPGYKVGWHRIIKPLNKIGV